MRFFSRVLPVLLVFLSIVLGAGHAHALKIIPPRVVVDSETNIEHVFIKNDSEKRQAFRFGWRHLAMKKDGEIVNVDKVGREVVPDYKAADDILRYSPRRTVLEPGEVQRVTLLIRRSPDMAAGEYRSHFLVEREPDAASDALESMEQDGQESQVNVKVLVSRAFPVYVRHGEVAADLKVVGATMSKNTAGGQATHNVKFQLQKEGNGGVIGMANVMCGEQKASQVGKVFAVYAEADSREEEMGFVMPEGGCASGLRLVVDAHSDDPLSGKRFGDVPLQ